MATTYRKLTMRYSQTQRRFYDMLMSSQYWSAEQLQTYQREQLSSLLRHAKATVPFYASRLDVVFRADNSVDWERWLELPILTRGDLANSRAEMQSTNLPPWHGRTAEFTSSGSTGTPVVTTHNGSATLASTATAYRFHQWHGLDWSHTLVGWNGFDEPSGAVSAVRDLGPWGPPWSADKGGPQLEVNVRASPGDVLEVCRNAGATYLSGGANDVRLLAYESRRLDLPVQLNAVLTRGAVLTRHTENLLRDVLGARAIPVYSSKEGYRMAQRCSTGRNYHVNAEIVYLEVLDSTGRPVLPGETGRVIITPLFSAAQPLIRYEQGDLAQLGNACSCGRCLPVLEDIVGRMKHVFRLSDGRSLIPRISADSLTRLRALTFQIAQTAFGAIEVRYVPIDPTVASDEGPVAAELLAQTEPKMTIVFKRVTGFPRSALKHMEYVSELPGEFH